MINSGTRSVQRKCSGGADDKSSGDVAECRENRELKRQATAMGKTVAPAIVHQVLASPGQPLPASERALFEPRFGHDFSKVRIHADSQAADSANAVCALAYTVGQDIGFAAGQFAPYSPQGRRLLAHELAHVVQQGGANANGQPLAVGRADDESERAAEQASTQVVAGGAMQPLTKQAPLLQRQPAPQQTPNTSGTDVSILEPVDAITGAGGSPPGPHGPTFSIIPATYLQQVNRAIGEIGGNIVASNTLANEIRPILQAMYAQLTWRDSTGTDFGGNPIQHTLPGTPPVVLNLRLILDDQLAPPDAGQLHHSGNDLTIFIRIRNNPTIAELKVTLFHEALHLMSWIINTHGAARAGAPRSPEVRGLTQSRFTIQIAGVRNQLEQLASSVNGRRGASGQSQLAPTDLQTVAEFLVEEVQVRAETEVFRLATAVQEARAAGGPAVIVTTGQNTEVNRRMVENYVFNFSRRFLPGDRTGLTPGDQQILDRLTQLLEGLFQIQVRRRFSLSAYMISVPRTPFRYTPPPLTPPPFRPLPMP